MVCSNKQSSMAVVFNHTKLTIIVMVRSNNQSIMAIVCTQTEHQRNSLQQQATHSRMALVFKQHKSIASWQGSAKKETQQYGQLSATQQIRAAWQWYAKDV